MPKFNESKNKMTKPVFKMSPKTAAAKGKAIEGGMPQNVADKIFKMDSSHSFKMKDAYNMKTMYMGSTYSMEPMDGDKNSSNPFAVDLGKPSKTGSSTFDLGLGKPSGEPSRDIKDIQKNEYREAQDAFNIVGPLNAKDETNKTGEFTRTFTSGEKQPSKTIKPASNKIEIQKPAKSGSFGTAGVATGPMGIPAAKPLGGSNNGPSKKITPTPSASQEIRAITPRETRRNERNVKFLKRRIRKAERKGDNSASLRQSLSNAQAQQAGNFLPGDKFTQPSSGSTYQTPKQVRESKKSENKKNRILKGFKKLTAKKEGGTKVGNAARSVKNNIKKKAQNFGGFKFPF